MKRRVYISGFNFIIPHINSTDDLMSLYDGNIDKEHYTNSSGFTFDSDDPLFPSKNNLKSMRPDVIASSICVKKLLSDSMIDQSQLEETPLYIASGQSLDNLFEQVNKMFQEYLPNGFQDSPKQQNSRLIKALHPLFILKSLSNAAACYIAQGSNIKGTNTTLASTSQSGFYALEMGVECIAHSENEMAIVGVSSDSGTFSDTTLQLLNKKDAIYKKGSSCVAFFILESKESLSKRNKKPLCEIDELINPPIVPDIYSSEMPLPYSGIKNILEKKYSFRELVLFTGGYTNEDFLKQSETVQLFWNKSFSFFNNYHNFGTGGLLVQLAAAITILQKTSHTIIDCIDSDPYGRESFVSIKKCREVL